MRLIRNNESGATAVEYGLMLALLAVVIAGTVATLGTNVRDRLFQTAVDALSGTP